MRFYLSAVLLTASVCLSGCQMTSKDRDVTNFFPLPTAVQINYQDEVNLLHLNQLLADDNALPAEQQARLLYDRALIYDRMGLSAHSRYDLTQAINTNPLFAPAYNTLGFQLLLSRSYDEAFEAFDSALELSDKIQYSYLHRAFGLSQVGRDQLASQDIKKFYAFEPNDPYRILWRYIINSKLDPQQAFSDLKSAKQLSEDHRFAWALIDVIVGRVTEKQLFSVISYDVQSNKELAQRLCEAYFYLGYWHKLSGDLNTAIYYFKLTTAGNIQEFIEYKYALIELASIQLTLQHDLRMNDID